MKNKDNTFSFEKSEDSTGFLLWQVTNLWQREIKKALERYELTHAQFVLLASAHWLSLQKKDVTQILLSNHTQIDPMTTSTVLRTLQTKGFIIRTEHKTDTRAKTVELTDVGLKNIKQAIVVVENFDRQFFGMLDGKAHDFNSELIALLGNKNNI
ncbi:MarR family transcriptional regulator [Elizabethkingia ursingii]|uniref:MarR family winged helix-turn-helix transcriptional regulator n=1 Tax=Elizabethkingia ursingii TaxID=1756150 RepID=UPI002011950D|nr:MarR family transcriptional regulator [Elizabethkingia ursingii]MCL1665882.1 MarR family transcriptional regulator [Elizabethkingia ursingii]